MSERAKIRQRKVTGNSQKQQREIAKAIRIAREMALLPFNVRQVTSKTKKRRDGDDEGTLDQVEREARGEKPERSERRPRADKPAAKPIEDVAAEETEIDFEAQAMIEAETAVASEES